MDVIFRGQVFDTFVSIIMDLPVGCEGQSQRPPSFMRDFWTGDFMSQLIATNQQRGGVFFLSGLFLHIELNEEAGPILFELFGGFHTFEESPDSRWLIDRCCAIGSKSEMASVPSFPFIKGGNVDSTDITGRPGNGHHIPQFLLNPGDQVVLLKLVRIATGNSRVECLHRQCSGTAGDAAGRRFHSMNKVGCPAIQAFQIQSIV